MKKKKRLTCESQSSPGREIWLDALEPLVQATVVVDMEQVSGSQDVFIPGSSFLFKASWEAAASTNASVIHFQ